VFSKLQSAKQSKKFFWLNSPCHFRLRRAPPTAVVKSCSQHDERQIPNFGKVAKTFEDPK
jgi:hypothetical protein